MNVTAILLLLAFATTVLASAGVLQTVNEWNVIQYDVPFDYPNAGHYNPEIAIPTGFEVGWDKIYITTPRFFNGIPATIGWIPRNQFGHGASFGTHKSPLLQAYPSWEWHADAASGNLALSPKPNCSNLVSVFRVKADRCNRLWVLDTGVVNNAEAFNRVCPPKLIVFDMKTDRIIRSTTLPNEILRPNTLLTNLVIDYQTDGFYSDCENVFVYMTDTLNPALLVYDARHDRAWRLSHPLMFPDPDFGKMTVAGESFTLMDGIIGLDLSDSIKGRLLYFQPFASDRLFTVPTSVLKAGPNLGIDSDLPVSVVNHKSSQCLPLTVNPRDGALIFSPITETALVSWLPGSLKQEVLVYSPEKLQSVLDLKSVDRDQGTIWVLSSRLQKYFLKTLNPKDVNIRLMKFVRKPNYLPYTDFNNNLFL